MMVKVKGKRPGPKKGVPKPLKRPLDRGFPDRLRRAMGRMSLIAADDQPMNATLAGYCGCSRQVIGQYLKGKPTIDALLLLKICDELSVTPYWLALNQGDIEDVPLYKVPMQEIRHVSHSRKATQ